MAKIPVLDIHSTIAGETVQFNGVIASTAYPYSIHRLVMDTEIYIRLPKSIKIENLKLTRLEGSTADRVLLGDGTPETGKVKSAPLQEKTDYTILDSECANDYRMYKISFESGKAPVGWFTQNLGQYQIGLSFDMKIDKVADAMALDMRNCVRIKVHLWHLIRPVVRRVNIYSQIPMIGMAMRIQQRNFVPLIKMLMIQSYQL